MWILIASLLLSLETVDQRTFADGSVQERWSYAGTPSPETLSQKEWFWPEGERRRLEEYRGGVLHGRTAEWDSAGRLQNEAQYADGVLHGPVRTWESWGEEPWVSKELNYHQGQLHGDQTRWSERGVVEVRNHYEHGQLHGNQQAWQSSGSAYYDLNFDHGVPTGQQRIWGDSELEPELHMHFVDGVPDGPQRYFHQGGWNTFQWAEGELSEGSPPQGVQVYALALRPEQYYGEDDASGPLRFEISHTKIRVQRYFPSGAIQSVQQTVAPFDYAQYAESGQLVLQGQGQPHQRQGQWQAWREDGSLEREEQWTDNRVGVVQVYDPQGALRREETWNWDLKTVRLWDLEDGVLRASGEVLAQRQDARVGTWTYYAPDGAVRRTERYEWTSGNVPVIVDSRELRPDGTLCVGPQGAVICTSPTPNGGTIERTVKAQRSARYTAQRYDPETFTWTDIERESRPLAPDAQLYTVLDGPGVVLLHRTLDPSGQVLRTERYDRDGALEEIQTPEWTETYAKGELRGVTEPHPEGGVCTAIPHGEGFTILVTAPDGTQALQGADRHQDKVVAKCPMIGRLGERLTLE